MLNTQALADKAGITLSLLCAVHCMALPLLIVLVPSIAVLGLQDEAFHFWMVIAVIPTSAFALTMGCKKHKHFRLLAIGAVGLGLLIIAAFFGHDLLGEFWEKALTVAGASVIAFGHFYNYSLCQRHHKCHDTEQEQHHSTDS